MSTMTCGIPQPSPSIDDMLAAKRQFEALPKGKWLLVSPAGDVWMDEKPDALLPVLLSKSDYLKASL